MRERTWHAEGASARPRTHRETESPTRWRPAFWRTRSPRWSAKYGDYIHNWWVWLGFIVNQVTMGYIRSGSSMRYSNHDEHRPGFKAQLLAEEIRKHLEATYHNG